MQGLWKESIGGWNHKDTKRKKQTRKNTLRDKGKALLNVYDSHRHGGKKVDPNIFREEGLVDIEVTTKNKSPIYDVIAKKYSISYPEIDKEGLPIIINHEYNYTLCDGTVKTIKYSENKCIYTSFVAYLNNGYYKDPYTHKDLLENLNLTKIQRKNLIISEIHSTNIVVKLDVSDYISSETYIINDIHTGRTKEFMYNKPLYKHIRRSFFNDGKRRKWGQKWANTTTRNNVKQWIRNGDFDKEIKNHPYEKSIAWLIH